MMSGISNKCYVQGALLGEMERDESYFDQLGNLPLTDIQWLDMCHSVHSFVSLAVRASHGSDISSIQDRQEMLHCYQVKDSIEE